MVSTVTLEATRPASAWGLQLLDRGLLVQLPRFGDVPLLLVEDAKAGCYSRISSAVALLEQLQRLGHMPKVRAVHAKFDGGSMTVWRSHRSFDLCAHGPYASGLWIPYANVVAFAQIF